ncbi:metallophosphoesterase [Methylophilus medardicus]|uniref:Metallophosphoesterase n=1 Tax=Methylophilus medardicus TaxID=2588534 RepID=A0A5B8CRE5_9PROT|nr:metallophosphoesterase [Methylophilus medardicus]QDC43838.1 metallophosphoesterase [Methylophilus medardicus]QDC48845.1 metallophosphoesterase [Methylophilus medardicus]QDC52550.1 metallophosphoesterase [Methylophilus medardicus]
MPLIRFLMLTTTLVGLLHYYIGVRLLSHLPWPTSVIVLGWAFIIISALLQPTALLARRLTQPRLRDAVTWVAMTVMGLFSSLLVLTLLRDVVLLVMGGLQRLQWLQIDLPLFEKQSALLTVCGAGVMSVIGFFNARKLARVVNVTVPLSRLPVSLQGFRIVQISDIHVGPTIKQGYLARIVDQVNALEADLIAITGDLVDGRVHELSSHTQPLSALTSRHGSFFVTGNHEYYAGALAWIHEIERLGIKVLLNEHVALSHEGATLVLAGVTDFTAGQFYDDHHSDPQAAITGAPAHAPKILLAHQPRSAEAAEAAGFDLQLSGHTHGGQFWPWKYFVPLQQPYVAGLHRLQDLWVYVSRGTGYWGPPTRFGAPSEITCLTLVAAE